MGFYMVMRFRLPRTAGPLSNVVAACLLGALGCAPQGGSSDGCPDGISPGKAPVGLEVAKQDGGPVAGYDFQVSRRTGEAAATLLELNVQVRAGWCESSYAGPLTLALAGQPAGSSCAFSPATLPAAASYSPRTCTLSLGLPATAGDGIYPLKFSAAEGGVDAPAYRLVVTTR